MVEVELSLDIRLIHEGSFANNELILVIKNKNRLLFNKKEKVLISEFLIREFIEKLEYWKRFCDGNWEDYIMNRFNGYILSDERDRNRLLKIKEFNDEFKDVKVTKQISKREWKDL